MATVIHPSDTPNFIGIRTRAEDSSLLEIMSGCCRDTIHYSPPPNAYWYCGLCTRGFGSAPEGPGLPWTVLSIGANSDKGIASWIGYWTGIDVDLLEVSR